MSVNCGGSFGVCAVRVTKLDGEGNVSPDTPNTYVSTNPLSVAVRPNIETGQTFSARNGCGCSVVRFKAQDIFNWWEFTLTDTVIEPVLEELLLGATPIKDGVDVVGAAFPGALPCDESAPQVALEFWTQHVVGSGPDGNLPRIHWVFPLTIWQRGDNTFEEAIAQPAFTAFSRTNQLWGQGPYSDGPPDGGDIPEGGYWKTADPLPTSTDCAGAFITPGS